MELTVSDICRIAAEKSKASVEELFVTSPRQPKRIHITRAKFEELFNLKPEPHQVGFIVLNQARTRVIFEYVFTDNDKEFSAKLFECALLERMYKLEDTRQ